MGNRSGIRLLLTRATAVAGAVWLAGSVHATTLVKFELSDLARDAERIVIGTVTAVDGRWDESLRFIHSEVTLTVERSIRGDVPSPIVLRTPGGFVGGMGQRVDGAPTFEVGERVMLFLTRWEDGALKVLGYAQGKSRIVRDEQGRERLRGGSADGLTLAGALGEVREGPDHNVPLRPAY